MRLALIPLLSTRSTFRIGTTALLTQSFSRSWPRQFLKRPYSEANTSSTSFKKETFSQQPDDFAKTRLTNPQYSDNNGLLLVVAITPAARDKLLSIAKEENNPNVALRVSVSSGGCHGFQYNLELNDIKNYDKSVDSLFERDGAKVLIDKTSLEILRDSKIDYTHELIGSQFKVTDSPYTATSCGCGSSFDFDFDKLKQG
ncbi:BA75_05003T0 [Komagataella pastoris]|uniref:BA75_05003T0 n=1 Tax=Komagataella pastoris TaxID=4922 RepID=A0A1B2JGU3_PICPA|nr:BA75_05003T0 [Komagataella pastoris]